MQNVPIKTSSRKIVLLSQWFPPEHAPIGFMMKELAEDLARTGWDVTVVTGFPNHPGGVVFGGYRKKWFLEERIDGIRVWRTYLYTSEKRTPFRRILTFASFTVSSWLVILFRARPSIIFSVLQPLSVGLSLTLLKWCKRSRLIFNVQDLHPDAPIELGLIRSNMLICVLRAIERLAYRNADRLVVICEGFRRHCIASGANAHNVQVIENWIDLDVVRPDASGAVFRAEIGLLDEDFVVLYAGTIGLVSGAGVVIEVASLLRTDPEIKLVLVGEGPLVTQMKAEAHAAKLKNVVFVPFQSRERLNEVQAMADLSIVTLLPEKGKLSVPSKVLGYMAAARCVVCSADADSETARLISVAACGVVTEAGNATAMADAISQLKVDIERRAKMASSGRVFLEKHLSRPVITRKYLELFQRVADSCSA